MQEFAPSFANRIYSPFQNPQLFDFKALPSSPSLTSSPLRITPLNAHSESARSSRVKFLAFSARFGIGVNCDGLRRCARVEAVGLSADIYFNTSRAYAEFFSEAPWGTGSYSMARKTNTPTLGEIQDKLKANGFEVTQAAGTSGGLFVAKFGCAAVLVAGSGVAPAPGSTIDTAGTVVAYGQRPGAVIAGEVSRLLDRGYQKFMKTSKYELPATAAQLNAIHHFTEELTQITGGISLYNESLGTTSDLYQYDRVKGREALQPTPARPWELTGGH